MWLPFPRSLDPSQLDVFVASCPASVLRSDAAIIGLHPVAARKVFENAHIVEDVVRRIEGAPLLIVSHQRGKPVIRHVGGEKVLGLESQATLDRIREQDVAEVVRRPGSELLKHPGIHYEGPNGDHYEAFLRPGFAARSIEELDRLAFWLAPMLLGKSNLLVDHWSMISIAYHVGGYFAELGASGAVKVQSLQAYEEDREVLVRRLGGAFGTIEPETGAVLLSVNSSGRLARDVLLPAMTDVGFRNTVAIAVAQTPSRPDYGLPSLTTLGPDFVRHRPAKCPACTSGTSVLIPIQQDSYLLNLSAYIHPAAITRKVAQRSTEVVQRYSGIEAFRVHMTHSDGRHHAYFVDLMPIVECDEFAKRLTATVRPWRDARIDLIVHPAHPAARRLGSMVAQKLGVSKRIEIDERRVKELTGAELDILVNARRVCLVDDVVISGARVFGYRSELNRTRRKHGTEEFELYCLVGVARATSERALMGVSDMVHHSTAEPRFLSVESFFLPNWDQTECRWCAELRILSGLPREVQELALVRERLQTLRRPEGLVEGLFLPGQDAGVVGQSAAVNRWPADDPDYGRRFWELGPKSVFGEVQNADLAVSVAASIQWLRGRHRQEDGTWLESELDEVFHSPVAKVLDPQLYLAGRYYEPVLVAAILRASRGHDIRAPGNDLNLGQRIKILVDAENSKGLYGELLLAARLDQVPRTLCDSLPETEGDMAALARAIWSANGSAPQ